ncbi:flagellar motor protein MotB [Herminiimonas sp. CN]|uniref:flagellar motor protein MotB n=1 Tax=Herminiimonas sp. CN TaxID=1349818 RepID=UPI000473AEEE|nr:flagellar motor protein MotB [Herminiimonas sp. CN]
MSKHKQRIIVRRAPAGKHQAHGGAWKIAYADFMTAMMALFLVLWLLAISKPEQIGGIAEYFRTPLKVAITGGQKSSTSTSVIPGGGTDSTHSDGEVNVPDTDAADVDRLEELKQRLDQMIDSSPVLKQFRPQLLIDITSEGLRIQIVDSQNRPMFDLSSAAVKPYMGTILREIGPVLNDLPNSITLSGHTDATPYVSGEKSYSNWELSADRANASRRELVAGGMLEPKVLRVMGVGSTMHLNKKDALDPINRRISIIVLNRRAQARIEQENASAANAQLDGKSAAAGQLGNIVPAVPTSHSPQIVPKSPAAKL